MLKTGLSINLGGKKIYTLARVYAELGEFSRLAAILVNCDLKMLRNEFLKIKKSARRYGGSELQSRIDKYWNLIK